MLRLLCLAVVVTLLPSFHVQGAEPDDSVTPGALCRHSDPDFDKYAYSEKIAHCRRHVTAAMKKEVADQYGVPKKDYSKYEFDHLYPLCAGGANSVENLWPQPHAEALEKDKIEDEVCQGMKAGTMTQKQAIRKIDDWFDGRN